MRTSQVIQQAQTSAANAQKPYVVYCDCDGGRSLKSAPSKWGQAALGMCLNIDPEARIIGFAFPDGRFQGSYR